MSDIELRPTRLSVRSYGVVASPVGNLITIDSLLVALDYIYDDDSQVSIRMNKFLDYLVDEE